VLILRISVLLLPAFSAVLVSAANAEQGCEIEQAQRLFGRQPRPVTAVEKLLQACLGAGTADHRIFMFEGVMARDAGETDRAIELLQKAHQMAPAEPNPALELAFTLERQHGRAAAAICEEILSKDPAALNGLAWGAHAERNREEARAGFDGVLALDPKNQEARIISSKVDDVCPYVFDVNGVFVSTNMGTLWGGGAAGLIGIPAVDTLEVGELHHRTPSMPICVRRLAFASTGSPQGWL
jgi:tetratricopeptide (TPR) repeat protein